MYSPSWVNFVHILYNYIDIHDLDNKNTYNKTEHSLYFIKQSSPYFSKAICMSPS